MTKPVQVPTQAGLLTTPSHLIGHAVEEVVKLVGSETLATAQSTKSAVEPAIYVIAVHAEFLPVPEQ